MIRVQVQLTGDQHRALKRWASRLGISFAEAVRRCVADRLAREEAPSARADRVREAQSVVGKYGSGRGDTAERHDDELAGAYGEDA